jgi:hypothetical protein
MAYYRLYFMDGLSGHVTSFVEIEAKTDSAAIERAETRREHVAMELWCGRKKVKHWPPNFGADAREPSAELPT